MDIKHVLSINPALPAYGDKVETVDVPSDSKWLAAPGGLYETGHDGAGFAFDNESPRHRNWVEPFALSNHLVTNGEYLEFIRDGGYRRPPVHTSKGQKSGQKRVREVDHGFNTARAKLVAGVDRYLGSGSRI